MIRICYIFILLLSSFLFSIPKLDEYEEFALRPHSLKTVQQSYFKTLEPLDNEYLALLDQMIPKKVREFFTQEPTEKDLSSKIAFFQGSPATAKTLIARTLAYQTNSTCHVISAARTCNYILQAWFNKNKLSSHKTRFNKALETLFTQNTQDNHVVIIKNAENMGNSAAQDLTEFLENSSQNNVKFILTSQKPSYYLPDKITEMLSHHNKFLFRPLNESERQTTLEHFAKKASLPLEQTFNKKQFHAIANKINGYSFEAIKTLTNEAHKYACENYGNPTICSEHFDQAIKARKMRIRREFWSKVYQSCHVLALSFLSLAEVAFRLRNILKLYHKFI